MRAWLLPPAVGRPLRPLARAVRAQELLQTRSVLSGKTLLPLLLDRMAARGVPSRPSPSPSGACFAQVPAGTDLVEWYFAQGWTDGLPVVPRTREMVDVMVAAHGGEAEFLECRVPPRHGG